MPSPAAIRTPVCYIDNTIELAHFLNLAMMFRRSPPALYIDIQGKKLGRNGKISLLTIYSPLVYKVYIIDVHTLGKAAFDTPAACHMGDKDGNKIESGEKFTLGSVLQREDLPKVFFDVRSSSDALNALYGVKLDGVIEIQLLECVISGRQFVESLEFCMKLHGHGYFDPEEKMFWSDLKKQAREGIIADFEILDRRPLDIVVQWYCVNQVLFLPALYTSMSYRLTSEWERSVKMMSKIRVRATLAEDYVMRERDKWNPWRQLEMSHPFPRL